MLPPSSPIATPRGGVRMEDIAREAGVSRRAVSKVLFPDGSQTIRVGEKTAERIREIARRMGYLPNVSARQLAGEKSRLIGVLIDSFAATVAYEILARLERSLALRGYRLLIGQLHDDIASIGEYLRDFTGRGVEGVISFVHHYPGYEREIREIYRPAQHVVSVGAPVHPGVDNVRVDTALGIRLLLRHLHTSGRRRIALFLSDSGYASSRIREEAFHREIDRLGLDPKTCTVATFRCETGEKPSREAIHEGLSRLVDADPQLDAIVASNDLIALCTIQFLAQRGMAVPQGIAVTGFDNLEFGWAASPPITTIDQRSDLVAEAVTETLLRRVAEPALEPQRTTITPRLIVRESA